MEITNMQINNAQIKPLYDRVLIKRLENEEKSIGGIIIPDVAKEKAQIGKVISVGQGRVLADGKILPMQIKPGQTVFFGKYSGTEFEDCVILREDEILGIIE